MFEGLLAEHQAEIGAGMEFSSLAALKVCLAQGWGVAILPAVSIQGEPLLRILKWAGPRLATGILMVWHREKWISPLLASFMDLMREEIGRQLSQGT
jgi:DNA-binding transcriptional LysR family regulator